MKKLVVLSIIFVLSCRTGTHQYYDRWFEYLQTDTLILKLQEEENKYPESWKVHYYLGLSYLNKWLIEKKDSLIIKAIEKLKYADALSEELEAAAALMYSYSLYAEKLSAEGKFEESIEFYKEYINLSEKVNSLHIKPQLLK